MRIKSDYKDYYDFCAYTMPDDPKDSLWIRKHQRYDRGTPNAPTIVSKLLEFTQIHLNQQSFEFEKNSRLQMGYLFIGGEVKQTIFKINRTYPYLDFPYRLKHKDLQISIEEDPDAWEAFQRKQPLFIRYRKEQDYSRDLATLQVNKTLNTAVTFIAHGVVHVNPPLIDLGYKEDPYQLYQRLEAFWDAAFTPQPMPIPVRSQELIRDAHGFDNNSFKHRK